MSYLKITSNETSSLLKKSSKKKVSSRPNSTLSLAQVLGIVTTIMSLFCIGFIIFLLSGIVAKVDKVSFNPNRLGEERESAQYKVNTTQKSTEDPAVTKLREYMRINTSHPDPDYETCIKWFENQAVYFGLKFNFVRFKKPDLFAIWFTWEGSDPHLPSILLNSHMDVVAANRDKWIHDPFEAYKDSNGNIYGRGAVDMKSQTIAELEAIRRLKNHGFVPLRSVHVSIIPDEEIGGTHGMKAFVNSQEFKNLNIGFDMDEGHSLDKSEDGSLNLFAAIGQKSAWQFNMTSTGQPGHGSAVGATGTAGEKIRVVLSRLSKLKYSEIEKLNQPGVTSSDITTINLVRLGGGIGNNVLPSLLWAMFDMRIRVHPENSSSWKFNDYEKYLNDTCVEAGSEVSYTFQQKGMFTKTTLANESNIWWKALQTICDEMNWKLKPTILSPTTDGGYVRELGIPTLGFSLRASIHGKNLGGIHEDNEAINEKDFLESIERYMFVIKKFSCVSP